LREAKETTVSPEGPRGKKVGTRVRRGEGHCPEGSAKRQKGTEIESNEKSTKGRSTKETWAPFRGQRNTNIGSGYKGYDSVFLGGEGKEPRAEKRKKTGSPGAIKGAVGG